MNKKITIAILLAAFSFFAVSVNAQYAPGSGPEPSDGKDISEIPVVVAGDD